MGFVVAHMAWFGHMGGWWFGMAFGWLLLVGLLVWAVRTTATRPGIERRPGARELLDHRYAGGEIDRDEYLQRRSDLEA